MSSTWESPTLARVPVPPEVLAEEVTNDLAARVVHREQFERVTLVEVPRLVRANAVPAAQFASVEKKVDRREGQSRAALVIRLNARSRSVNFGVVAAFGMGLQLQRRHQLLGACVHGGLNSTKAASEAQVQ